MPRFTAHKSAPGALNYYLGKLADYFDAGPAFAGQWVGTGADRLGLRGEVEREPFKRLLNNRHPEDNTKLTERDAANRRVGWDVNFNASKSVSVVFGLTNDLEIVDALRASVDETLLEMEQDVMTRVNLAGKKQQHKKTGNMVAGVWIHPESRAVGDQAPDPNLHAHAFISNHTWADSRWTAADISLLWADSQKYFEAAFQSRFADRLQAIGYQVERSEHNFEITGISPSLKERFSKLSKQIEAKIEAGYAEELAAKKGISLADAKDMVGGLTRKGKGKSFTLDDLQNAWQQQVTPAESHQVAALEKQKTDPKPTKPISVSAADAVTYALDHRFEKEAAVRERDVLRDALLFGIGDNTVSDIRSELGTRQFIRQGKDEAAILTTKDLQDEEKRILDFAKLGRGRVKPLYADYQIEREWLSDEQKKAVLGILHSPDRFQILRGVAGVGKTTLLEEAVPAMVKARTPVAVMAPTQKATQNLINDGFGKARTVQSFLLDEKAQQQIKNGVLVVDESGLVDNPTFAKLVGVAEKQNARILAVGDSKQHAPVGRGAPLKLLEKQGGIRPKVVSEIRRQQGKYKEAVQHLSRGDVAAGFEGLKDLEYVHEIQDESRDKQLAEEYRKATYKYKPSELLVIAATHAEGKKINTAIRGELKAHKIIKGKDRELTTLLSKQLSTAERRDPLKIHPGDVVAYHAKAQGGIETGDQFTVSDIKDGKVLADNREIDLTSAASFNVFRPETAGYAKGDVIRLTRGRKADGDQKQLNNGSLHTIKSFHKGVITLEGGQKLPSSFRFFTHGRVITSHVSQGTTVKRAFVAASSLSFPASSPEQMYVSASRAKKRVDIYTDSVDGLERAISRIRPKALASDVKPEVTATKKTLAQKLGRVKQIAQQYATKQLQRFHDWLPGPQLEPELGR